MAKTLAEIQQQIERLQQRAEALKAKEAVGVVQRIRTAIAYYGLTVQDLFNENDDKLATPKKTKAAGQQAVSTKVVAKKGTPKNASRKGIPVAIKYRDDEGNTWTGRGSKPRWLVAAFEKGGVPLKGEKKAMAGQHDAAAA